MPLFHMDIASQEVNGARQIELAPTTVSIYIQQLEIKGMLCTTNVSLCQQHLIIGLKNQFLTTKIQLLSNMFSKELHVRSVWAMNLTMHLSLLT